MESLIRVEDIICCGSAHPEEDVEFIDRNKLSLQVEKLFQEEAESYASAVLMACDLFGIDVDEIPKYLSPVLIDKLKNEAIRDGALKSSGHTLTEFF